MVRQPREAVGESTTCSSCRPASSTSRGRRRSSARSASSRRRSGCGRRAGASVEVASTPAPGSPTRRSTCSSRPGWSEAEPDPDEGEELEIVQWPLGDLDGADRGAARDAKSLVGLLLLRDRPESLRSARARDADAAGRTWPPWRLPSSRRPSATVPSGEDGARFEGLVLDFLAYLELERGLSRNTLNAYRTDLLQFGEFLAARDVERLAARPPTSPTSSPTWRPATADPACSAATIHRKAACLRSFYKHLRREELVDEDPTAALTAPRRAKKASPGPQLRRGPASCWRRRAATSPGAARPRAARGDVRVRAAGLGDDRPRALGPRPPARLPPRPRQGFQGAAGAARAARRWRRSGATCAAGRPELVARAARAKLFVNFRGGALTRQGLYKIVQRHARSRGPGGPDEPAHPAPQLRHPSARRAAATCGPSRRCSATPTSRRPRCTRTSPGEQLKEVYFRRPPPGAAAASPAGVRARHPAPGGLRGTRRCSPVGCGNERAEPADLDRARRRGGETFTASRGPTVAFRHPESWLATGAEPPRFAQLSSGGAVATVYGYPRRDLAMDFRERRGLAGTADLLAAPPRPGVPGPRHRDRRDRRVAGGRDPRAGHGRGRAGRDPQRHVYKPSVE